MIKLIFKVYNSCNNFKSFNISIIFINLFVDFFSYIYNNVLSSIIKIVKKDCREKFIKCLNLGSINQHSSQVMRIFFTRSIRRSNYILCPLGKDSYSNPDIFRARYTLFYSVQVVIS